MVEKWKAQEIVQYLEGQLSNSLLHDDLFESMEDGYRCAINDIKERYIEEDWLWFAWIVEIEMSGMMKKRNRIIVIIVGHEIFVLEKTLVNTWRMDYVAKARHQQENVKFCVVFMRNRWKIVFMGGINGKKYLFYR